VKRPNVALGALDAPNVAFGALDAPNAAFGALDAPNATLGRLSRVASGGPGQGRAGQGREASRARI